MSIYAKLWLRHKVEALSKVLKPHCLVPQTTVWVPDGEYSSYPDLREITGAIVDDNAPEVTNEDDLIVVIHHSTRLVANVNLKIESMPPSKRVFF